MSQLFLYTTEDNNSFNKLRAKNETGWFWLRETAELFDVSTDNVGMRLKNICRDAEPVREAATEESSVAAMKVEEACERR